MPAGADPGVVVASADAVSGEPLAGHIERFHGLLDDPHVVGRGVGEHAVSLAIVGQEDGRPILLEHRSDVFALLLHLRHELQLLLLELQLHLRRPRLRIEADDDVERVDHLLGAGVFEDELAGDDAAILHGALFVQAARSPGEDWRRRPSQGRASTSRAGRLSRSG